MKATINDVAKQAGVSIKTVSRVMNNEPSVRQPTREKVMEAVNELNYKPNLAARNLAGTKAYSIAFIYDNPNAYYVIDMQNGILSACKQQGFELLIHPCNSNSEGIVDEITNMVKHSRIAGLVLTPPLSEMPEFVKHLLSLEIDVVRIMSGDIAPDDLTPCIMVNDHQASMRITQHLIDLGHTDIGFLAGQSEHMSTVERLRGYKQALEENGIKIDPRLIIDGEYSFESGVNGAKQLMAGDVRPTAIFSCNDEIAAGALFASRLMGIPVPEQLSITGFENSPFSRQTWPRLTTANQPNPKIAEGAANLLIAKARKQAASNIITEYTPQLVVRDSTSQINQ
ncbi:MULTISPECIES: LacI family DNA-binding transcriptional regulator [Thalassotalea]|uniref:LacI family DNA-binding transcriptional regulator n=1 Tax=Thalassotalea castellviae TaxID=3075612 RepID=A0ABU2ZYY1_9GAMM|nr:LacI family DNA-binding transcriptional regulator [Thalassotalea sp. W431]MDT0603132.1 LacI family DNA-binding transcriptional regulator [Thalassotalea sp. W431]